MNENLITAEQIEKLNQFFKSNNKIETDEDLTALADEFDEDE